MLDNFGQVLTLRESFQRFVLLDTTLVARPVRYKGSRKVFFPLCVALALGFDKCFIRRVLHELFSVHVSSFHVS